MALKMGKTSKEVISLDVKFTCGIEHIYVEYFGYVVTLFDLYSKHGVLPYTGSLSEQPAKIIDIFNVLDQLYTEREKHQIEEHRKEQAKNNRKTR